MRFPQPTSVKKKVYGLILIKFPRGSKSQKMGSESLGQWHIEAQVVILKLVISLRFRLFGCKTFPRKCFFFFQFRVFGAVENLGRTENVLGWPRIISFPSVKCLPAPLPHTPDVSLTQIRTLFNTISLFFRLASFTVVPLEFSHLFLSGKFRYSRLSCTRYDFFSIDFYKSKLWVSLTQ